MYQNRQNLFGRRNTDPKTKKIAALAVVVIALANTVLPFLVNTVRRGIGTVPSVLGVMIIVFAVIFVAGMVALRVEKKRKPWNAAADSDSDMMHLDHYRRTKRQRTHHSADPCAYSERHSWRKSQTYDDPWDF